MTRCGVEEQLAPAHRTPEQQQYLATSLAQFWDAVDRTFALAQDGKADEAHDANSSLRCRRGRRR